MNVTTVAWNPESRTVRMLDQTRLPNDVVYDTFSDYRDLAFAIKTLKVRGAPAIGVSAAFGVVLGIQGSAAVDYTAFKAELDEVIATLGATRPTAVNLFWALERMRVVAEQNQTKPLTVVKALLLAEAIRVCEEDRAMCTRIGEHGATLLKHGQTVLTHCNAGALATAGSGTALAVVYQAIQDGKQIRVFAD